MPSAQAILETERPDEMTAPACVPVAPQGHPAGQFDEIELPRKFEFEWSGMGFSAALRQCGADSGFELELICDLGSVPYTAENKSARREIKQGLLDPVMPLPGRFRISPDKHVTFSNRTTISDTATGDTIVTALTVCLLQIAPVIGAARALVVTR